VISCDDEDTVEDFIVVPSQRASAGVEEEDAEAHDEAREVGGYDEARDEAREAGAPSPRPLQAELARATRAPPAPKWE
jgi:hypothetical protein